MLQSNMQPAAGREQVVERRCRRYVLCGVMLMLIVMIGDGDRYRHGDEDEGDGDGGNADGVYQCNHVLMRNADVMVDVDCDGNVIYW